MTDATSSVAHQFTVADVAIRGTPTASAVFNELDSHGVFLGLPRLPDERNAAYKKRLLDVFARRANSTELGLLNGITRELGLEYFKPVKIVLNPLTPSSVQPAIEFKQNTVLVYSDKATNTLELELKRSAPGDEAYWLTDFITNLNTQSSYFTATITAGQEPYVRTDTLINQSSAKIVNGWPLRDSHIQDLPHQNIQKNSIVFTDRESFRAEVSSELALTQVGHFYVDYPNGVIKTFAVPSTGVRVRYVYHETTFDPVASPVILRSLQSDLFKEEMFLAADSNDGTQSLGVPSEFGALVINELMSVFASYWGE